MYSTTYNFDDSWSNFKVSLSFYWSCGGFDSLDGDGTKTSKGLDACVRNESAATAAATNTAAAYIAATINMHRYHSPKQE
jgi:hypothetical protein